MFWKSIYEDEIQPEIQVALREFTTIDHYCIILYEHTMLVAGVFLSEELKPCPIMLQNRTKMTFSPNTWAYIKLNTILMRFFKIKCCCSDWNNWYIWGCQGARVPLPTVKNFLKIRKKREKNQETRKNWEEKAKLMMFFHFTPLNR